MNTKYRIILRASNFFANVEITVANFMVAVDFAGKLKDTIDTALDIKVTIEKVAEDKHE